MKKTLAFLIVLVLLISLPACGSGSNSTTQNSNGTAASENAKEETATDVAESATSNTEEIAKFENFIKDYVDLTHYDTVNTTGSKGSIALKDDYKPDYETKKDVSLVNDIKVVYEDDIEIKKGTKYQEFLDKGWEPKGDLDYASLENNYIYSGIDLYKNDKKIQISLMSDKKETTPIKDCVVATAIEYSYKLQDTAKKNSFDLSKKDPSSPDYMINGKISKNSSLKDIISAFGEPTNIVNTEKALSISYYDAGNGELEFMLSPDGKVIASFILSWHE